ncbi:MAG: DNA polymerase III subunit gamma/tau [Alphaproteobacteria bacterium]
MDGSDTDIRQGEAYRVLARKYRPDSFTGVVGQEAMVQTLTNAFRTGRIAQAYMLTGVRGVGKTTTARILARALNYEISGEVDQPTIDMPGYGEHCAAIMEGRHVDVIEMDAASHTGIDDIREIIEAVRYKPAVARYKVYIIDEVHMLSKAAFNGLLKTLEEPPPHVKFIFATTEIRKVPVTVLSRCQRFDLRRIESGRLMGLMRDITEKESVVIEEEALTMLARAAEGSARDGLSLLDQAIAHADGHVTAGEVGAMLGLADRALVIDLFEEIMGGDTRAALTRLKDLHDVGADPVVVLEDLAVFTHTVTRLKVASSVVDDEALTEEERSRGTAFADKLSLRALSRAWQMLLKGIEEARTASRPLAAADMVIVRLAHAANLPTPDEALKALGDGSSPAQAVPPSTPGASPPPVDDPAAPAPVAPSEPRSAAIGDDMPTAAPAPAPVEAPPVAQGEPKHELQTFDDLVALAGAERELKLKHLLETAVRPARFEDGRIEMGLTEHAPPNFAGDLGRRLEAWTGRRWMIAVNRDVVAPTIEELRNADRDRLFDDARDDPVVAAVMTLFPGAEVVDVRVRSEEADAGLPDPDNISDDNSDDDRQPDGDT